MNFSEKVPFYPVTTARSTNLKVYHMNFDPYAKFIQRNTFISF